MMILKFGATLSLSRPTLKFVMVGWSHPTIVQNPKIDLLHTPTFIHLYFNRLIISTINFQPRSFPRSNPDRSHLVLLGPEEDPPIASPRGHDPGGGFVAGAMHETHVAVLAGLQHLQQ